MGIAKTKEREILEKLIEAKKLEAEALLLLLPEGTRRHMEALAEDMKAMVTDMAMDIFFNKGNEKPGVNSEVTVKESQTGYAAATVESKIKSIKIGS